MEGESLYLQRTTISGPFFIMIIEKIPAWASLNPSIRA